MCVVCDKWTVQDVWRMGIRDKTWPSHEAHCYNCGEHFLGCSNIPWCCAMKPMVEGCDECGPHQDVRRRRGIIRCLWSSGHEPDMILRDDMFREDEYDPYMIMEVEDGSSIY
jgi:hypothetical protein